MSVRDATITVTVDTALINKSNVKSTILFSDDLGDPISFLGEPENFITYVEKDQTIIWKGVPKDGSSPVYIQNVKIDGGSKIIEHIKRGEGHNLFTAHIINDENIKEGDEDSYSMTISLSGYEGIAGDNQNGPVVFLANQVAYMSYRDMTWRIIPGVAPFDIDGIAGDNQFGPIVFSGDAVAYMNDYGKHTWNLIAAKAPFKIEGITGDNHNGVVVYSGKQVAYMNSYVENKWHQITDAPFEIDGIAGDNRLGVIIYSGSQVAYMQRYADNKWTELPQAPYDIEGIAGDNENGVIAYAGSQISYLTKDRYSGGDWRSIGPAPFTIEGITGNNRLGCIVYSGPDAVYMNNYASNRWVNLATMPFDTKTFTIDPKLQIKRKERN